MRLARYRSGGGERTALVIDRRLIDVHDLLPDPISAAFPRGLSVLEEAVASGALTGRPSLDADTVDYAPPVRPSKIICVGLNFADHAREGGLELPPEPVIFMKAPNCVVGPNDDVLVPPGSEKTDYEIELAVVVGRRAAYLTAPADAASHIAGYTISDDVSERHWQLERSGTWDKGKCFATFNPLGPWLVTPDEVDVAALPMLLRIDGDVRQDSSTEQLVFGVDHLVWYISQFMTLEPGDVINTGTPAGVGLGFDPPRYIEPGQVAELTIEGLGRQRHRFVPYAAAP